MVDPIENKLPQVVVRRSSERAIAGRHPWLLASAVQDLSRTISDGEVVDIVQTDGRWIGRGIYNSVSRIRVRVYSWVPSETLDATWFIDRLNRAIGLRKILSDGSKKEAQRIVFSEADQLSGLIVDRYADYLVVQQTSAAMNRFIEPCVARLVEEYSPTGVVLRIDQKTATAEGLEAGERLLYGQLPTEAVEIQDNGLTWMVDLLEGQKTGYYLDQRTNRRAAADWVPDGGRALDVCCYVGGFALSIAKWSKAEKVIAIDTSAKVIELARQHATLNGITNVEFEVGDFYESLEAKLAAGERFDTVVLDPPRMAGSRGQIDAALRAYHRLNLLGVQLLKPGGILVTCSCSGRIGREDFHEMLHGVSRRSGREIQILERRGAAADHPSCVTCPETDYLKCFICRVL